MSQRLPTGLDWTMPSELSRVDGICQETHALLHAHQQAALVFTMDLLLREFLNNAIIHGNKNVHAKQVQAALRIGRKWVVLRIRDEGRGFKWRKASQRLPDETATSGRGLMIGKAYAGRMRYNQAGNEITLWIPKSTTPPCLSKHT
jgi:anti-sigma regulatory factor (Ser/Thr protein kinase)